MEKIYGCSSQETRYNYHSSLDKSKKDEWHVWKTSLDNEESCIGINFHIYDLSSIFSFFCAERYVRHTCLLFKKILIK